MADTISFKVFTADWQKAMKDVDRRVDRATMYGLRAVGRRVKQEAKKEVPVVTGALKASIHSSRRLRPRGPGAYEITVAPRGYPPTAYAAKIEASHPYMRPAYDRAVSEAEGLFETAWGRAMRR